MPYRDPIAKRQYQREWLKRRRAPPCKRRGCSKPSRARGLCATHYKALRRKELYDSGIRCAFAGCERGAETRGYCNVCYLRLLRGGKLQKVVAEVNAGGGKPDFILNIILPGSNRGLTGRVGQRYLQ